MPLCAQAGEARPAAARIRRNPTASRLPGSRRDGHPDRSSPERIPGAETTGKSAASVGLTPQEGRNIKQFLFLLAGLQPVLGIEPKGRLLLNIRLRARPWSRLRTGCTLRLHAQARLAPLGGGRRSCGRAFRLRRSSLPTHSRDSGDERPGLAQAEASKGALRLGGRFRLAL